MRSGTEPQRTAGDQAGGGAEGGEGCVPLWGLLPGQGGARRRHQLLVHSLRLPAPTPNPPLASGLCCERGCLCPHPSSSPEATVSPHLFGPSALCKVKAPWKEEGEKQMHGLLRAGLAGAMGLVPPQPGQGASACRRPPARLPSTPHSPLQLHILSLEVPLLASLLLRGLQPNFASFYDANLTRSVPSSASTGSSPCHSRPALVDGSAIVSHWLLWQPALQPHGLTVCPLRRQCFPCSSFAHGSPPLQRPSLPLCVPSPPSPQP